jgi:Gti1/Pac2 family transcription factor
MASKCVCLSPLNYSRLMLLLAAYFTQATVDSLGTVDDIPVLKDLVVPEGLFKSSRRTKTRSSRANAAAHTSEAAAHPSTQVTSGGKTGSQIAPVAGPSSTVNRPPPPNPAQSATPQQNQGLPSSAYPQSFFGAHPHSYSGLPTTPSAPHDAYARMPVGDSHASSHPHEGYHISPPSHVQPHMPPLGYNWSTPPVSAPNSTCQSPYPYPVLVASQNGDSMLHHSPAQSQLYVYESGFPTSPTLYPYRTVSPALSHATSQLSASSQSQSSSESDSPAPGPVSIQTPFFSSEPLPGLLHSEDTKFDPGPFDSIREGPVDRGEVCLAPLETLTRYQPFPRYPLDELVMQRLGSGHV